MEKLGILIDSTSSFDWDEIKANKIEVISNSIYDINGKVYIDECTDKQKLEIGKLVNDDIVFKTSLINSEEIETKLKEMLNTYERIIFLCIGPGFSGQYDNAINVSNKLGTEKVCVLHSNSTACQSEMILHWLLDYIKDNEIDREKMQAKIIELSNHMTTMFTTDNYKGFINTGRVPLIVAKTLKLTKTFPIICAEEINKRERFYRKWNHALDNILEAVDKRFDKKPRSNDIKEIYLCQSLCEQTLIDELIDLISSHFEIDKNKIKIRSTPLCVLMTTCLYSFGVAIWTADNINKKKFHWKI